MKVSKKENVSAKPIKKKEALAKRMKRLTKKIDVNPSKGKITKPLLTLPLESETDKEPIKEHKFYSSLISNKVLVLLCKDSPLVISGAVDLVSFTSNVELFGYRVGIGEKVSLYNPIGFNTLAIEVVSDSTSNHTVNWKRLEDFTKQDIDDCKRNYLPENGLIILSRHTSHKVKFVQKMMKEHFFPSVNRLLIEKSTYTCEYLLNCSFEQTGKEAIVINPHWNKVVLEKSSRVIVVGSQNVGKSTLLRYMVNSNLKEFKKIVLIDLDVGQSESFLPQTISASVLSKPLLGPGYFQSLDPEEAIFVGQINILLSPESYLKSVIELMKRCRENKSLQGIPWVFNTMGYFKGFGLELLIALYKIIQPTDVVKINDRFDNNEGNQFQSNVVEKLIGHLPDSPAFQLHQFEKNFQTKKYQRHAVSTKDIRHLIVMCGLSGILKSGGGFLNEVTPVRYIFYIFLDY